MFIFVCHSSSVFRCDFPILCTIYSKIICILQIMLCSPLVSIKVMGCFVIYWVSQIIVEVFDILCRGEVDTRQHSLTSQNWCFVSFTSVCKNVKMKETNYKSCQTSQQTVPIKYLELDWEFQVFCQGGIYCFHLVTDRGWAEVFLSFCWTEQSKGTLLYCVGQYIMHVWSLVTCLGRHRGGGNTLQWRSSRRRCPGRRRRFCTCHHTPAPGSDQYVVICRFA